MPDTAPDASAPAAVPSAVPSAGSAVPSAGSAGSALDDGATEGRGSKGCTSAEGAPDTAPADAGAGARVPDTALEPMVGRRWISCSSCHPDGEPDGRTWQNPEGLRNTQSLAGMAWTRVRLHRPWHRFARRCMPQPGDGAGELAASVGVLDSCGWGPAEIVGFIADGAPGNLTTSQNAFAGGSAGAAAA